MFAWFNSKFAMLVAAVIMISSVLGFFKIQHENFKNQELQSIADSISSAVSAVSSSTSELKLRITFNSSKCGLRLPPEINGKNYKIELTPDLVIVTCDNVVKVSRLTKFVCLWNPSNIGDATIDKLELANSRIKSISCYSYEDFFVENKFVDLPNFSQYLTFIWLERSAPLQKEALSLANEINNFVKASLNTSTVSIKRELKVQNQISFYRGGVFILEEQGLFACGFVDCDYLWNPANLTTKTTSEYLNETDKFLGNGFFVAPNESFWLERKLLELTDIELEEGIYKCSLVTFLYAD